MLIGSLRLVRYILEEEPRSVALSEASDRVAHLKAKSRKALMRKVE